MNNNDLNLEYLQSRFPDWTMEYFEQLASTNQYAQENKERLSSPAIVVAENQTAGKGRGRNCWWSSGGALTFSLLVSPASNEIPAEENVLLSLMTAAMVREAILETTNIATNRLQLKWPNDLYLDEKKLSGILLEQPGLPADLLVIGIGINVNNSFQDAPEEVCEKAIALSDVLSNGVHFERVDRTELLHAILNQMQQLLSSPEKRKELFPGSWDFAHLLDQRIITLEQSGNQLTGLCEGIDETGALLLRDEYRLHRIHSAVILDW